MKRLGNGTVVIGDSVCRFGASCRIAITTVIVQTPLASLNAVSFSYNGGLLMKA